MNTNINTNLKKRIMLGVYIIFLVRKLRTPVSIELFLLVISSGLLASSISIQHILANSPHDVMGIYHFSLNAFINTDLIVKCTILAIVCVAVFLTRDVRKQSREKSKSLAFA